MIKARGIHYAYPEGQQALRGVDFSAQAGQLVGLLGHNGSGKSTLLRHLNGLLSPSSGMVYLEGRPLAEWDRREVFRRVGLVFQDPSDQLILPTVGEDVSFGPCNLGLTGAEVKERMEAALEMVGLAGWEMRPIRSLSFGQKRLVCIAGVLAMEPRVMLLDEPTGSLDPMGSSKIIRLLLQLNQRLDMTVVLATHDIDILPLSLHRLTILKQGKVEAEGSLQQVFSDLEALRGSRLRLPRIAQLFQLLKENQRLPITQIPLTVGQGLKEIMRLLNGHGNQAQGSENRVYHRGDGSSGG